MIKFTKLSWSNAFSYGDNNTLDLSSSMLTQLLGENGNGKSSIASIIEEVLFNTNSKKIKKADILNRYVKTKSYSITIEFKKDGVPYTVTTNRGATSTVKLLCGKVDISNHTATGTYKQIENLLGFDHKTFSQIVYLSNVSSLEFLTATDSARKKFLIDLLNLGKYTKALEVFKELASGMSKQVDAANTKIATITSWLNKYKNEDLTEWELEEEPPDPRALRDALYSIIKELESLENTNKKITQNNTYKAIFEAIELGDAVAKPDMNVLYNLKTSVDSIKKELADGAKLSNKPSTKTIPCPTCNQEMDNSVMFTRVINFEKKRPILENNLKDTIAKIATVEKEYSRWTAYDKKVQEWEKYHALVDTQLTSELKDKDAMLKEVAYFNKIITERDTSILDVRRKNRIVTEHNSKAKVIREQLEDMQKELVSLTEEVKLHMSELSNLQVLVKAFSNTGLVAYKIECMVKDLEKLTNEYLGIFADGRFQLSFKVVSDKLNVIITDNGRDIDIVALSSGERARVNIATLLAIRALMQALSNSRTNLLILDETIESLDAGGKEKLIEILLEEDSLNVFLVSHGFSHPLLEKISVIKENNISRLE